MKKKSMLKLQQAAVTAPSSWQSLQIKLKNYNIRKLELVYFTYLSNSFLVL